MLLNMSQCGHEKETLVIVGCSSRVTSGHNFIHNLIYISVSPSKIKYMWN